MKSLVVRLRSLQESSDSKSETVVFGKKTYTIGKRMKDNSLRKGVLVAAITKSGAKAVEILGVSCSDKKYAQGGVKHKSMIDVFKSHDVYTLKSLEALDSKNDYGHMHYLISKDDNGNQVMFSVFNGRWVRSAGEVVEFRWLK